jgi:choline monooxygenase
MGVNRTIVVYEFFFGAGATEVEMDEMVQFALQVQQEDVEICESVQRGLQSGRFDRGRLFLTHENGTQHFEGKVLDALSGRATATAA